MLGPDYTAGCPSCSAIADGFNGSAVHLANHDVTLCAVSRAPLEKIQVYRRRMGWSFPWASAYGSDFNFDFGVAHTKEEWEAGTVAYNFGEADLRPAAGQEDALDAFSQSIVGTDWQTYRREGPGMSAFALQDGTVYHAYSAYARGLDGLWGMYHGSTARRSAATRTASGGGAATTSTTASERPACGVTGTMWGWTLSGRRCGTWPPRRASRVRSPVSCSATITASRFLSRRGNA